MRKLVAALCALVFVGSAKANVSITGNGKVTYVPNIAHVNVSVTSEAKTAAEAWRKNSEIVQKLFAVLKDFKIDEKDFKTARLHVNPKYFHPKNEEPRLIGYAVTYDLHLTVRQLKEVGAILDRMVEAGANRGLGITFSHDNLDELLNQARLQAVADARRRAQEYVQAAGGSLGVLVSIGEGQRFVPATLRLEHAPGMAEAAFSIAAGQQDLTTQVTVTYAINNGLTRS